MNRYNFNQDKGIITTYDDFLFEQQAIREAFKAVLGGIGAGTNVFVISGCETIGDFEVTDGFVSIDGEVCKHTHTLYPSFDTGPEGYYWEIEEDFDPAGEKVTVLTATVVQQRIIRKAICKPWITGALPIPPNRLDTSLTKRLNVIDWVEPTNWSAGFATDPGNPFKIGKDIFGFVHFKGNIKNTGGTSGFITTSAFPAEFTNGKDMFKVVACNSAARVVQKTWADRLFLTSNDFGTVFAANELISMDGISYFVGV